MDFVNEFYLYKENGDWEQINLNEEFDSPKRGLFLISNIWIDEKVSFVLADNYSTELKQKFLEERYIERTLIQDETFKWFTLPPYYIKKINYTNILPTPTPTSTPTPSPTPTPSLIPTENPPEFNVEVRGPIKKDANKSYMWVDISIKNRNGHKFSRPYAITYGSKETQTRRSEWMSRPGRYSLEMQNTFYCVNPNNHEDSSYQFSGLTPMLNDRTYSYQIEVNPSELYYLTIYCFPMLHEESEVTQFWPETPEWFLDINEFHWPSHVVAFNVNEQQSVINSPLELQFRWKTINDRKFLQVKNILLPIRDPYWTGNHDPKDHADVDTIRNNKQGRDSNDWSTVYVKDITSETLSDSRDNPPVGVIEAHSSLWNDYTEEKSNGVRVENSYVNSYSNIIEFDDLMIIVGDEEIEDIDAETGRTFWFRPIFISSLNDRIILSNGESIDGITKQLFLCFSDHVGSDETHVSPESRIMCLNTLPAIEKVAENTTIELPLILIGWDHTSSGKKMTFDSVLDFDFSWNDEPSRVATMQDLEDLLNSDNSYHFPQLFEMNPTGSVRDYYHAISHNQMHIKFKILPASSDEGLSNPNSQTINDYAHIFDADYATFSHECINENKHTLHAGLNEAFIQVKNNMKANGEDYYSKYGYLPICFIQAGFSASVVGGCDYIWSHKWSFFDTERARHANYNINPFKTQLTNSHGPDVLINSIGVICHESMHSFGLPDLYDTTRVGIGLGKTALMASGSWGNSDQHSTPWLPSYAISWTRYQLHKSGYMISRKIDVDSTTLNLRLKPVYEENLFYSINHPNGSDAWYVEYRTPNSPGLNNNMNFDRELPEEGLCIIHVSDKNESQTFVDNDDRTPAHRRGESGYMISIEQRDGKFQFQRKSESRNIADDFYKDGDELSPYTTPSTISQFGVHSGIRIHNIRTINNEMLFDVEFIDEPNIKILSIDYSFSDKSYVNTSIGRATWKKSDTIGDTTASVEVITSGVEDGQQVTMEPWPAYNNGSVVFVGTVVNNRCTITFDLSTFDDWTYSPSTERPIRQNIIRFDVTNSNGERAFVWNDYLLVVE